MSELAPLFGGNFDWLSTLPSYQQELVNELAKSRAMEDVAIAWLEAGTTSGIAGFGAAQSTRLFYETFLNLMHDLLCSDDKFIEERSKLLADYKASQTMVAASIASIIAPYVGTATPMLTTVVVIILIVISKAGLQSWCAAQAERRREAGRPPNENSR
jgi:hypothetical protein